MSKTVILSTARTPFGKMGGGLSSLDATDLGGTAISEALDRAEVNADEVQGVVYGQVLHPFEAWLLRRGLITYPLRMAAHNRNALAVAQFLESHPAVERVYYPGLPSHPQHDLARAQMHGGFGGMVSFRVTGGEAQALAVCEKAEVFTLGESLGGVESLIEHPGRMTHASVAGTDLEVPSDLIRLSVGIETAADLLADLDQALSGG